MSNKGKAVITGSVIITLIIGTLSNIVKKNSLPSFRFFFGSGILWLFLIGIGEFEEEVSKAIALAVATFTVIGEGGGTLDYFLGKGASQGTLDTTPPDIDKGDTMAYAERNDGGSDWTPTPVISRRRGVINAVDPIYPVKPVVPNSVVTVHDI